MKFFSRGFPWLPALRLMLGGSLLASGRLRAGDLLLTSPMEYQVVQRAGPEGGSIPITGRLGEASVGGEILEALRVEPGGVATWRPVLTLSPGQTQFAAELSAPAGGWYRMEVRLRRQEDVVADAAVDHVGVGEVFVIAGQSNSANHGEEKQQVATGRVSAFAGDHWQVAHDPQPGASGGGGSFVPPFADALATRLGVPIGIVAVGAGGTSVREWLPRGTRFPNPPTVEGNVTRLDSGEWQSKGTLFDTLALRLKGLGPRGARAVLWHQGESDAHQRDATRTLPGNLYSSYLEQLIRASRTEAGWEVPWFVAQVSYHTPDDAGSPDIRAAQAALWKSGVAMEGPDTDALTGLMRDGGGQGVHFSGPGLREHARLWVEKVTPWLESQGVLPVSKTPPPGPKATGVSVRLPLPGWEDLTVAGRPAFLYLPEVAHRSSPQPWIFYAPTLPGLPDAAERWMHEQFLAAGVAVAGVDVGEGYGSPKSQAIFEALHRELVDHRRFAPRPCLLGRSRGGLWVTSWATAHPERVAGIAGIYPVFDFRSYPGLTNAAPAYELSPAELGARSAEFNPVERIGILAAAKVPVTLIHGDADTVVPLRENSAEVARRYREAGADSLVRLIVLPGQGHNYDEAFFHSQELVDFAIARARAGAGR
ncbi:MAG: hypothetical protein RIS76_4558 [Verrucomicrobiota bacterium]